MASQVVKLYLRVRPVKDHLDYSINFKSFEFGAENFVFHKIFTKENNQHDIYEELGKPLADNIMRGINGVLIAYGPSDAGKTYSILGESLNEGIIPRILEDLFTRAKHIKSGKSIRIFLSCFEITNERIRDLARIISDKSQRFTEESLEIRENQGNVYIDNLTVSQIESLSEALHLIQEGRRLRKSPELGMESQSLVHTVLKITVSQKEMNMSKSATLTVVDLADSDSGQENINKTLESLRNLMLDLQQGHHASLDESTLSKILATNLRHNCLTNLLFHINPAQEQQTLNTLEYSKKCYSHINNTNAENVVLKSQQQANRIIKLQEEITDLKHAIEKTQEIHENKLRGFGDIIGFNVDIEELLLKNSSKEKKSIEKQLNAREILNEAQSRNLRLETKLVKNKKIFEEIQKFEQKRQDRNILQLTALEEQIRSMKLQIVELSEKAQENVMKKLMARTEELQHVLLFNHMELEEKAAVIHNLPYTVQSIVSDMRAVADYKEVGRTELEFELFRKFHENEEKHKKSMEKIKIETDSALKNLDQEARRFEIECNCYIRAKFEEINKVETELIACYNIILDHDKLIKDVENGNFNSGIKPIYLTVHEIPKPPHREKFPFLFKTLQKHGILASSRDNNFIKISKSLFTRKYMSNTKTDTSPNKASFRITFPSTSMPEIKPEINEEGSEEIPEEISEIDENLVLKRNEYSKLQQSFIEELKKLKAVKHNMDELECKMLETETGLQKITQDRERHKEMYSNLMKNKVVIESQKRVMDKYIFITEQIHTRPSTGRRRPVTANGLRLSVHKHQSLGF